MREIYVDHSATTKMRKEVLESMMPYLTEKFGNPSTMYKYGIENKRAIEEALDKKVEKAYVYSIYLNKEILIKD